MYEYYYIFYKQGYIKIEKLQEAVKWGALSKEDYLKITGEEYKGEIM